MASAPASVCSPLDIYIDDIDTDSVLVAKTSAEFLPNDHQLIPMIEDCCSNAVKSTYRHTNVDQVAIILFNSPIIDIKECQEELRRRTQDVFIFKIESRPYGLAVMNSDELDIEQLNAYVYDEDSGIGRMYRPEVLKEGALLIVKFPRKTDEVLRRVFSRTHRISGKSVHFHPYFPCFHDTLAENLNFDDSQKPYPEMEDENWEPHQDDIRSHSEFQPPFLYDDFPGSSERSHRPYPDMHFDPLPWEEELDDPYSPVNGRRDRRFSISDDEEGTGSYLPECPSPENEQIGQSLNSSKYRRDYSPGSRTCFHGPDAGAQLDDGYPQDYLNDGEEETKEISTSTICDDDEEEKIVSVCLESSHGKTFLDKFQRDKGCKINIKFKKKASKQTRTGSASDKKYCGAADRKSRRDGKVKLSPGGAHNAILSRNDPSLLMLGLLDPTMSLAIFDNDTVTIPHCTSGKRLGSSPGRTDRSDSTNINGTKLSFKKGDVTREKADVLVNVVGENLLLQEGMISRAYAKRGGNELVQSYHPAMQAYNGKGTIVCGGGKLSCKNLITVVLKQRQDSSSDQNFSCVLESVFQKAAKLGFESIVLPVMGSGQMLQYPLHVAVAVTVDTTAKVLNDPRNNFKEVTIVAFDDKTYGKLAEEINCKCTPSQKIQKTKATTSPMQSSKETVGCSIELSCGSRKVKRLSKELTSAIKHEFLFADNVTIHSNISIRTKTKLYEIADEHTKMPMKMEFDQSGSKVLLKGEVSQVSKVVKHLRDALSNGISAKIGKSLKCSPSTWYTLAHDSPISPPYWSHFKANTPLTVLSKTNRAAKRVALVPVDAPAFKKAISGLIRSTWNEKLVGQGRDAINLSHRRIKVDKIERIENIDMYSRYATKRHEHFRMLAEEGSKVLKSLEDINIQTKGPIATSPKDVSVLHEDVFPEINEHYMFHGTKPDVLQTVLQQGLDCRMSNEKAMFGMGIYGAESSTKADQYTDNKQQRSPGSKKMLLVRMLLGNMFVCKDHNPTKYRRPPCRNTGCLRDNCTSGHGHFDSVVGDGHWLFREFVVYTAEQCYPEYVITYHRE
ncbi:uncharacterized protein LOC117329640 [Pecten maximus]|uniref:uncharacterized protein LOC117329640 n=1 Tax=Pecten maximus TaxID=6579 RepID=UPI0014585B4E|nr:uncharacterized protein LOC117329640 [Pecten maximus]